MLRSAFSVTAHPASPGSAPARAASRRRRCGDLVRRAPPARREAQRGGGEAGRDSVERGEQPRARTAPTVLRRIRGVMFSAGCRARLSARMTRCRAGMPGSVVNSSAAPIWPELQRLQGERAAGVGRDEGLEPQPVGPLQPGQAVGPLRAFGWPAEHQVGPPRAGQRSTAGGSGPPSPRSPRSRWRPARGRAWRPPGRGVPPTASGTCRSPPHWTARAAARGSGSPAPNPCTRERAGSAHS